MSTNDYEDLAFRNCDNVDLYMMTGCSRGVASGRLSFILDLQGPSMTVDAACASSLVAVHSACQSLWSKECTLAIAGGTNIILEPEQGLGFSKMGLLSPDGRCKTFLINELEKRAASDKKLPHLDAGNSSMESRAGDLIE